MNCSGCGKEQTEKPFPKAGNTCAACLKRIRSRQWAIRNPDKKLAQAHVYAAIKNGLLVRPNVCEWCGKIERTTAHHEDYSQSLVVKWICDSCHNKHNASLRYSAKKVQL